MPTLSLKRTLPFSPQQLFDVVADIESYPEFLPWCEKAIIVERTENTCLADLSIGYKNVQKRYRSHVTFDAEHYRIEVKLVDGPFSHLHQSWQFIRQDETNTQVMFDMDYALKSPWLAAIVQTLSHSLVQQMMHAFEGRVRRDPCLR